MDYNNTRKSQPSPGLWSLIATGRVSDGGVVMVMCGCRRREGGLPPATLLLSCAAIIHSGGPQPQSYSCRTIAIFISQYQAPVPGVRGQHNDTTMISLFLLTICTCIPGPSNSRGGQGNRINNCLSNPCFSGHEHGHLTANNLPLVSLSK